MGGARPCPGHAHGRGLDGPPASSRRAHLLGVEIRHHERGEHPPISSAVMLTGGA